MGPSFLNYLKALLRGMQCFLPPGDDHLLTQTRVEVLVQWFDVWKKNIIASSLFNVYI